MQAHKSTTKNQHRILNTAYGHKDKFGNKRLATNIFAFAVHRDQN